MICRKCANIFDDSLSECPMCGYSPNGSIPNSTQNRQTISQGFDQRAAGNNANINNYVTGGFSMEKNKTTSSPTRPVAFNRISPDGIMPEQQANVPYNVEHQAPIRTAAPPVTKVTHRADGAVVRQDVQASVNGNGFVQYPATQRQQPPIQKSAEYNLQKNSAVSEKQSVIGERARMLIITTVCILALIMGGLTAISAKTDIFEKKAESIKTITLSSLSEQETASLENQLNQVVIWQFGDFDSEKITSNEFLSCLMPFCENGIYKTLYSTNTLITDESDPDARFLYTSDDEQEYSEAEPDYSYHKISENEIDRILGLFNLPASHTANSEDYYYHDGYYYFAHKNEQALTNATVKVTNGKRIDDGNYYVEISVVSQMSSMSPVRYLIVEKNSDDEMPWNILKISSEPIFDENGKMLSDDDSASFYMEEKTVEAVANDGTVYCKYLVRYPVFTGNSKGEQTATGMFSDMISVIDSAAQKANEDYEQYISYGGDKSNLPFVSETIAYVSYNADGYISVVKETADNLPDIDKMKADYEKENENDYYSDDEIQQQINLPKRTCEGYNLDKQTGDFITKDSIIGKDYQLMYELLYRIYNGYDYSEVVNDLSETTEDYNAQAEVGNYYDYGEQYVEIPEDEEELGKSIYESANALCEDGYVFLFVTDEMYLKRVVIPYDIENLFIIEK